MEHDPLRYTDDAILSLIQGRQLCPHGIICIRHDRLYLGHFIALDVDDRWNIRCNDSRTVREVKVLYADSGSDMRALAVLHRLV